MGLGGERYYGENVNKVWFCTVRWHFNRLPQYQGGEEGWQVNPPTHEAKEIEILAEELQSSYNLFSGIEVRSAIMPHPNKSIGGYIHLSGSIWLRPSSHRPREKATAAPDSGILIAESFLGFDALAPLLSEIVTKKEYYVTDSLDMKCADDSTADDKVVHLYLEPSDKLSVLSHEFYEHSQFRRIWTGNSAGYTWPIVFMRQLSDIKVNENRLRENGHDSLQSYLWTTVVNPGSMLSPAMANKDFLRNISFVVVMPCYHAWIEEVSISGNNVSVRVSKCENAPVADFRLVVKAMSATHMDHSGMYPQNFPPKDFNPIPDRCLKSKYEDVPENVRATLYWNRTSLDTHRRVDEMNGIRESNISNPIVTSYAHFDQDFNVIRENLAGSNNQTKDAHSFEWAVANALTLMGFQTLDLGYKEKRFSAINDEIDIIAFNPYGECREILLVEVTAKQKDLSQKITKLKDRRAGLEAKLKGVSLKEVVVTRMERSVIESVLPGMHSIGATIVAKEDLEEFLKAAQTLTAEVFFKRLGQGPFDHSSVLR